MQRFLSTPLCCLWLLVGLPGLAQAAEGYSLDVHEDLISSLAGKFSGQRFTSYYSVPSPWDSKKSLYRGRVTATVGAPTFNITTSGVGYSVRVYATLAAPKPFPSLSTSFTAEGDATATPSATEVSFSGDTVRIPVKIYIPLINKTVTIFTITHRLPFRVSVPIRDGQLLTENGQRINVSPTNLAVRYLSDWVRITGDVNLR